jgi:hypothetical protein
MGKKPLSEVQEHPFEMRWRTLLSVQALDHSRRA